MRKQFYAVRRHYFSHFNGEVHSLVILPDLSSQTPASKSNGDISSHDHNFHIFFIGYSVTNIHFGS